MKNYNNFISKNINIYIILDLKYKFRFIFYLKDTNYLCFIISDNLIINIWKNKLFFINRYFFKLSLKKLIIKYLYKQITVIDLYCNIELSLNIIGYKFQKINQFLIVDTGKNYKIFLELDINCIYIELDSKGIYLNIKSFDKIYLNKIVILLRSLYPINVYTGKGIKYINEKIFIKQGKKSF